MSCGVGEHLAESLDRLGPRAQAPWTGVRHDP
jgi:hypothetical protein